MPLFSVIIPVYNSEQYLAECIQSVLKRDFRNLEIILIDDLSTDKSGDICDAYANQNKFIKVIHHKKNFGVSASRNRGIREARGQYIIFLDSDDCLYDGCLDGVAKLIEQKRDVDIIIGKYVTQRYSQRGENSLSQDFTFDNTSINSIDPDGVMAHINDFSRLSPACWRYVMNREFIIENNLFFINVRIYEDAEFESRLLCLTKRFTFYVGNLYWYRSRSGSLAHSITHSHNYRNSLSFLEVAIALCKFARMNDLSELKKEFLYTRIKGSLKAFYSCLPIHNENEIHEFSKVIKSNIDDLEILDKNSVDRDFYHSIKTYGAYNGLLSYIQLMTNQTISLLTDTKRKELYIFCADLFGRATKQMLREKGYDVKGFLDNNKALEGSILSGLNVFSPSCLSHKPKDELSDIFVIVCQQKQNIFKKISDQLELIGLKREQIAHKIF